MPDHADRVRRSSLTVDSAFARFVEAEVLPGTAIDPDRLWAGFASLVERFSPLIAEALSERDRLQAALDAYHRSGQGRSGASALPFLREIGYLVPEPAPFSVETSGVDDEIARIAGPQLVVPGSNARYALNAANARWGSLYDAFYGTDAVSETDFPRNPGPGLDPKRAAEVVRRGTLLLDECFPLETGSHADLKRYSVRNGGLVLEGASQTALRDPSHLAGHIGDAADPASILLKRNGLHVHLQFDRTHPVGRNAASGLSDIVLESAVSTIFDCEDSVAAVDAADKIAIYRNWLGLMRETLTARFEKNGRALDRRLSGPRRYIAPDGGELVLPGRSLLLVRHVGHHMFTDAVLGPDGAPVPEGLLDAVVTVLAALHDRASRRNSREGSIYVVKPKMHGPAEVALSVDIMGAVEQMLDLPPETIKLGIMDEERRTSANLAACIAAARKRVVFINTGFLDRTGDEIHSAMHLGPVVAKEAMRQADWIGAYEQRNVAIGLACGLSGRGQIGKGMWAAPDRMAAMLAEKIGHPRSGASTAWVPSPTAATLHALHYLSVSVADRQQALAGAVPAPLEMLLTPPMLDNAKPSEAAIARELDRNVQSILGYVVRWVDMGIGCSKVPDIDDVGLMEDRATLRISSQFLANWLLHGLIDRDAVLDSLRRVMRLVMRQNQADPDYRDLDTSEDGPAFRAACDLIFEGAETSGGYTEPALHRWRAATKRRMAAAA
ncbi:malate synthase G [Acetobacteraceae bacterium KSS8]|uniref:Malate synthase G n=1 Tax=Endosaccharibacter trunci TaxID=2812733 RepID=A0ABT1W3M5_9PROT|nr:malate synthase G [Acetobacteraceae bacterium KSS8]